MSVRLGYACINTVLREDDVFSSRTLILKSFETKGVDEARRLAVLNIQDTIKILEWNEQHGIRFFRLTSNLFPHMENELAMKYYLTEDEISDQISRENVIIGGETPRGTLHYNLDFARDDLARLGNVAREYGHRITMHPGQFAQLGTPRTDVLRRTFKDLNLHAEIFLAMGMRPELGSVMIVHGGGTFGDKAATLERWAVNFMKLPESTRQFIVLENDERQYSVMDLLPMCERLNIPLCIDFFHHECSVKLGLVDFDVYDPVLIERVMRIWYRRGIVPKCHLSEQRKDARVGTHDDNVKKIPSGLLSIARKYNLHIMIESKNKEQTVLTLHKKYFTKNYSNGKIYYTLK